LNKPRCAPCCTRGDTIVVHLHTYESFDHPSGPRVRAHHKTSCPPAGVARPAHLSTARSRRRSRRDRRDSPPGGRDLSRSLGGALDTAGTESPAFARRGRASDGWRRAAEPCAMGFTCPVFFFFLIFWERSCSFTARAAGQLVHVVDWRWLLPRRGYGAGGFLRSSSRAPPASPLPQAAREETLRSAAPLDPSLPPPRRRPRGCRRPSGRLQGRRR
jgi:hypothetical protein